MKKIFVKEVDGTLVQFAFTRPSETSRARKFSEIREELIKLRKRLSNLDRRRADYVFKVDEEIKNVKGEIKICEDQLLVLNSPEFQKWLDEQRVDEVEAYAKAEDLMREYLGLETYARLIEQGELIFEVQHETWKITSHGLVYRKQGEEFSPVCVIRPKELPVPDFIVSALTTLKENPESIIQRR